MVLLFGAGTYTLISLGVSIWHRVTRAEDEVDMTVSDLDHLADIAICESLSYGQCVNLGGLCTHGSLQRRWNWLRKSCLTWNSSVPGTYTVVIEKGGVSKGAQEGAD